MWVFIRWLQENLGLTPVMGMGYLSLLAWAVLATVAIMLRASREGSPIEKSPWMTWHTREHD